MDLTYYVYVKGILNLYALVYQTSDIQIAKEVKNQYNKAIIRKTKMSL